MSHGHVLLVEDDDSIADAITLVLQIHGYEVHREIDPREGLAFARHRKPGVIILDPDVLGISAPEFMNAVHSDADIAGTPVILTKQGMQPVPNPAGEGIILEAGHIHELLAAVRDGFYQRRPRSGAT
jgi:DNA-binding NtrC family response regulator